MPVDGYSPFLLPYLLLSAVSAPRDASSWSSGRQALVVGMSSLGSREDQGETSRGLFLVFRGIKSVLRRKTVLSSAESGKNSLPLCSEKGNDDSANTK